MKNKIYASFSPKNIILIILGAFLSSVAINAIYLPSNVISGGVTGIALILHILFSIDTSLIIILLNIPIFIIGLIFINKRFIISSLIGMLALSLFINITKSWVIPFESELTTILLGGVINGTGIGLVYRAQSSFGGNDIISKAINKYFSYSIPTVNLVFNVIVVGLAVFVFTVDEAVLTLAAMYVSTVVSKFIIEGAAYKRTILIVSDNKNDIIREINNRLKRGCTVIHGTGSYTGTEHNLLYCVISFSQIARLKAIVHHCDPNAFMNIIESKAVYGNGKGFNRIDIDSCPKVMEDGVAQTPK